MTTPPSPPQGDWLHYRCLGLNLASERPFTYHIMPSKGPAELYFRLVDSPPLQWRPEDAETLLTSRYRNAAGIPLLTIYRLGETTLFHYRRGMDFYLSGDQITAHLSQPLEASMVESWLFGAVLNYVLESRGIPVLHASTVQVGEGAVAFLNNSGGGKSTLAAFFVKEGFPLLGDDLLPLQVGEQGILATPAYPQLRLRPETALRFFNTQGISLSIDPHKVFVPVGEGGVGHFQGKPIPLHRIYLLNRLPTASEVAITTLAPTEAAMGLVRYTFSVRLVHKLGWAAARLEKLAKVAAQVPLRQVTYPSGLEYLEKVKEAILEDLGKN